MAKKRAKHKLSKTDLKIQNTPMPKKTVKHSKVGRVHRMVLCWFLKSMFELNCTLKPSKKMTDGEIARQVCIEYPHVAAYKKRFAADNPRLSSVISKERSEYNRGRIVPSVGPPDPSKTSFAYDEFGNAVNMRMNIPKPLTPEQMKAKRDQVAELRKKFLEENPEHK